jgi:RNA polymerase-binding protein DksA
MKWNRKLFADEIIYVIEVVQKHDQRINMDSKKLALFRELLQDKQRKVMKDLETLWELTRESSEELNERSANAFEISDYGASSMDREKDFLFISRERKYLLQIDRALEAIDCGEYGICRVCGKEISEERLKAVPTTHICVPCKQNEESVKRTVSSRDESV